MPAILIGRYRNGLGARVLFQQLFIILVGSAERAPSRQFGVQDICLDNMSHRALQNPTACLTRDALAERTPIPIAGVAADRNGACNSCRLLAAFPSQQTALVHVMSCQNG
mmetsp:Transcript_15443/g.36485  ORF Transcript_15443/g.36485 Transcript_15443/m.36485 type:complete len:110 (-) Transcript_15443:72-401(-)